MDKVYTTLKQLVRDWAAEGQAERDQCYQPILDALDRLFIDRNPEEVSVLVPGVGLGRLAFECALRGWLMLG